MFRAGLVVSVVVFMSVFGNKGFPVTNKNQNTAESITADYSSMPAGTKLTDDELAKLNIDDLFYSEEISDTVMDRMRAKSYKDNCTVSKEELRYIRVLYKAPDGDSCLGELVSNKAIAQDLIDIFKELYKAEYPIGKMSLVDDYNADDELSMEDNNTSCFNFRAVSGSENLSKHAMGRAIDINPLYNPYIHTVNGQKICEPHNAEAYADRNKDFKYKIDKEDLCYKLFMEHGFEWGGGWHSSKDYQHFQKKQ